MIRTALVRSLLATSLVIAIPAVGAAQGEGETPEGSESHLTSYDLDGEAAMVPWFVDATLVLQDGRASGSTGCNTFTGAYELDGDSLTFDPSVTMTRMVCPDEQMAVEDGYMANLALVESWANEEGDLVLADADGLPLLRFEQSTMALTASDVAAIAEMFREQQAEIERLDGRIDGVRIRVLRDRVKELEGQVKSLTAAQAAEQKQAATTFSASERTLLQGIPSRIRDTCRPLRGSNPEGTLAAVRCRPRSDLLNDLAYYLMAYKNARRTFNSVMTANKVPEGYRCPEGRASGALLHPAAAEGCFVKGGRANVRFFEMAASCSQLNVGGTQVAQPVIYVAVEGKNRRIKPLYEWTRNKDGGSGVTRPIPAGGQPLSPVCQSEL